MSGFGGAYARAIINQMTGKAAIGPAPTALFVGLLITPPNDAGAGAVEVTGSGYARMEIDPADWAAASGDAPAGAANTVQKVFGTSTGDWTAGGTTPITAIGLYAAATGGSPIKWDWAGGFAWQPFYCSAASPGVFSVAAHGFSNGDKVIPSAEFTGTLPAQAGSWSGLQTVAGVTTDTFNLGVNTTVSGGGLIKKVVPQLVSNNQRAVFDIGTLLSQVS